MNIKEIENKIKYIDKRLSGRIIEWEGQYYWFAGISLGGKEEKSIIFLKFHYKENNLEWGKRFNYSTDFNEILQELEKRIIFDDNDNWIKLSDVIKK